MIVLSFLTVRVLWLEEKVGAKMVDIHYLNQGEGIEFAVPPPTVWLVQAIDFEGVYPMEVCATRGLARLAIMRIRYLEELDRQNDRRLLGKKFIDTISYVTDYGYAELGFTNNRGLRCLKS